MGKGAIVATSWENLISLLYQGDWDGAISRHRSSMVFRGMTNSSWTMKTSLMRLGGNYSVLEKHLLRNFRKYAHRDVVERDSFWHWLAVAQHHGLPTRLLDWTYSPFVAMHFATDALASMNENGVIWCVDLRLAHQSLPAILTKSIDQEGSYVFTIDMLAALERKRDEFPSLVAEADDKGYQLLRDLGDFDKLSTDPFALFIEPPSIDDRIVNQFALFSAISDAKMTMDEWLQSRPEMYKKVIIPTHLKWEVRDRLDQANVNERVIYPGLDGLSKWLSRHYFSRT
ncbi:FRG domain-containing protein [Rhizobium leguminosarum]|uniref:FRG domain-containing protein n=1 Tax=Rhizobium leguminosarum TaxID=384 RepID=UPI003F9D802A